MKFIFLILLSCSLLLAEEKDGESTITVHVTAIVEVPADVVIFRVSLRVEEEEPQLAFDKHKELEAKLLELVSKFEIPDSNITYSLLNLYLGKGTRPNQPSKEEVKYYRTGQTVHIVFFKVESYLKFQVNLLKNGFNQFSSKFSSTHIEGLKEAGYKKALRIAEEEASIISENMGKRLGPILQVITETGDKFQFEQPQVHEFMTKDVTRNLTDIGQNVSTRTKLRVVYKVL